MRDLSPLALTSANAQQTSEVWLALITITHPSIADINIVNNTENITSGGVTYTHFPFEIEFPGEDPESPGPARLRVDQTDGTIVQAVRSINSPATVSIKVIIASQPDTIEAQYSGLFLRNVNWDVGQVIGSLVIEEIMTEPIAEMITPREFPGLF